MLVTGGLGFIGAHLVNNLIKKNFKELYLNCLIKQISPEIIVQNDLNLTKYDFKDNFPNINYVIYQFGFIVIIK